MGAAQYARCIGNQFQMTDTNESAEKCNDIAYKLINDSDLGSNHPLRPEVVQFHSCEFRNALRLTETFPHSSGLITRVPETHQTTSLALEVQRFVRANASTLLATAVEWVLVTVMVRSGGSYLLAAGCGAFLGALMDFALKRQWAFMRRGTRSLRSESTRYVVVSAFSLGWNLVTAFVLVHFLRVPAIPGVIAASVLVGAFWNYPLHRLFVFPEGKPSGLLRPAS